jgi:hypothetical protein
MNTYFQSLLEPQRKRTEFVIKINFEPIGYQNVSISKRRIKFMNMFTMWFDTPLYSLNIPRSDNGYLIWNVKAKSYLDCPSIDDVLRYFSGIIFKNRNFMLRLTLRIIDNISFLFLK